MKPNELILAAAAILVPATEASAQVVGDYRVRVGIGAQVRPEFPGAEDSEVAPYPSFSFAKGDKPFSLGAPDDSLGIGLISSGGFSAGPAVALMSSRQNSDVGAPVGKVPWTFEAGAFVQQQIGDSFRLRGEVRRGVGGHGGLVGHIGVDYMARDADKWTFTIGPRVRFANGRYMREYFGVTPEAALATGLPTYRPDGGVKAVGMASGATYSLGGPLGLFSYVRYDRLVGDAKRSPIIRQLGSRNQWSAGVGLSYVFNLKI